MAQSPEVGRMERPRVAESLERSELISRLRSKQWRGRTLMKNMDIENRIGGAYRLVQVEEHHNDSVIQELLSASANLRWWAIFFLPTPLDIMQLGLAQNS